MSCLVNFGSGPVQRDGWVSIDRDPVWGAHLSFEAAGIAPGSVEVIVANHVLQMTHWHEQQRLMAELVSYLAPGGVLRVLVPDVVGAVLAYQAGDSGWFPVGDEVEATVGGKLSAYLTWYSDALVCFTPEKLGELMVAAGLVQGQLCSLGRGPWAKMPAFSRHVRGRELDTRQGESIIAEAVKP